MFGGWSVVFNADQVEGFTVLVEETATGEATIIEAAEKFMAGTGATIRKGGARASYNRTEDYISLPDLSLFHDTETSTAPEAYFLTAFHELTHWTGAPQQLERQKD